VAVAVRVIDPGQADGTAGVGGFAGVVDPVIGSKRAWVVFLMISRPPRADKERL